MSAEDDLGWEYFGSDPMNSPRMMEHMDWHTDPANQNRTGNYGERFISFHKQFIEKFDQFRITKGLLPVTGWNPTTPIPPYLSHDHTLTAPRNTDNPYSVDPGCATPSWATVEGGTSSDPVHGYTSLLQFRSIDELGWSIDSGWHGTVHNTIGGDMAQFHSPIDPIFWRWHKWIDNVRATWEASWRRRLHLNIASTVMILSGITNDAPGVAIGPNGMPIHVPGGPGPLLSAVAPEVSDVLVGMAISQLAHSIREPASRIAIHKLASELLRKEAQHFSAKMSLLSAGE